MQFYIEIFGNSEVVLSKITVCREHCFDTILQPWPCNTYRVEKRILPVEVFIWVNSVRQTNSAQSNLSLNIQGHVEVPKSKFFLEKIMSVSCNQPLYVKI